jgi:seryl-tRNA synthetase
MRNFPILALLLVVTIVAAEHARADDDSTDKDAEIRMLRAAVKNQADSEEPLRAKIREQERAMASAAADANKQSADDAKRIATLDKENEALQAQLKEAMSEIDRLKALMAGGDSIAGADGVTAVNSAQMKTIGERFNGQKVKMVHCTFDAVDNILVDELPGVTLSSNGLISEINRAEHDKWIGFSVRDKDYIYFAALFAEKKDFADLLVALKTGATINVTGTVVALENQHFGIVCSKIEKVPDAAIKPAH